MKGRRGEVLADALGQRPPLTRRRRRHEEDELLAPAPHEDVDAANVGAHPIGEPLEHGVARRMAVPIVHAFEMIEIQQRKRQRRRGTSRALHLFTQPRKKIPMIEGERQVVDDREPPQACVLDGGYRAVCEEAHEELVVIVERVALGR